MKNSSVHSAVITIDCEYGYPRFTAAYLIVDQGRAVFVENNTTHAVPLLLKALKEQGLTPDCVDYAIITHVHIDHAGGSSALMKACPNAKLLAHPRAARHVIDPSRLIASAKQVYGEEFFEKLYGVIEPVPAERVQAIEDETVIEWQSRKFRFIHTRGHANHHFCIYDSGTNGVFTGDSFGISYPDIAGTEPFYFVTTSPTDFDAAEAFKSFEKIVATGAETAYLTHYGEFKNLPLIKKELDSQMHFTKALFDLSRTKLKIGQWNEKEAQEFCREELKNLWIQKLKVRGVVWTDHLAQLLKIDLDLNAAGIVFSAGKTVQSG